MPILRNLTPHPIRFIRPDGSSLDLEPTGQIPRVKMRTYQSGTVDGIPIVKSIPGAVEELPDAEDGVYCVVSRVVAEAAPSRTDLLVPDDLVRDEKGRIVGARRLGRVFGELDLGRVWSAPRAGTELDRSAYYAGRDDKGHSPAGLHAMWSLGLTVTVEQVVMACTSYVYDALGCPGTVVPADSTTLVGRNDQRFHFPYHLGGPVPAEDGWNVIQWAVERDPCAVHRAIVGT